MTKPADKTSSSGRRQIAPPPFSQHLREFASNPHSWVVFARNMIPVIGVYAFGWSAGLIGPNDVTEQVKSAAALLARGMNMEP